MRKEIQRAIQGEIERFECEIRMRTKSGAWKWVLDIGEVIERDEAGKGTRIVGVHIDIDGSKQIQRELEELRVLLENSTNPPWSELFHADLRNERLVQDLLAIFARKFPSWTEEEVAELAGAISQAISQKGLPNPRSLPDRFRLLEKKLEKISKTIGARQVSRILGMGSSLEKAVASLAKWWAFAATGNQPGAAHIIVVAAHTAASLLLAWVCSGFGMRPVAAGLAGFPADGDHITAGQVEEILHLLAAEFDVVVVDTSAGITEVTLSAANRRFASVAMR